MTAYIDPDDVPTPILTFNDTNMFSTGNDCGMLGLRTVWNRADFDVLSFVS